MLTIQGSFHRSYASVAGDKTRKDGDGPEYDGEFPFQVAVL